MIQALVIILATEIREGVSDSVAHAFLRTSSPILPFNTSFPSPPEELICSHLVFFSLFLALMHRYL